MTFMADTEEQPHIFRRNDVRHANWYCRVKVPHVRRYKTIALKTANEDATGHCMLLATY